MDLIYYLFIICNKRPCDIAKEKKKRKTDRELPIFFGTPKILSSPWMTAGLF